MKQFILITTVILTILCSSISYKPKENPRFNISFYQDGQKIELIDNTLILNKKEFDIRFELNQPMGIHVATSYNNEAFERAQRGFTLDQIPVFESTGMAEEENNKDIEVLMSNESTSYWYYDNDKENRFNKIEKKEGKIIVTRSIRKIVEVENDITRKIEEVEKPIYMVFTTYKHNKDFTKKIEYQRFFVKIEFK
jgi:hypothetical protein